jgi:hypothetical protein
MAIEILIPNTDSDELKLTSIEITFGENAENNKGEEFIDELIALTTKYENALSTLTFKEN